MISVADDQILFVAPSAYPLGGVAVWLHYLIEGLMKKGVACHLGLLDGQYHQVDKYLAEYSFSCNIVKIKSAMNTRYGRVAAIKKAATNVSATMVVSVNIPDVFEAVTQLKLEGRKIRSVMTLHALEPAYFQNISEMKSQIDAIVVTNELTRKMVNCYAGFDNDRIFYAPYGVEVSDVLEQKTCTTPVTISYVGRLDQCQKRCMDLLQFVANLEAADIDYKLQIIGDGGQKKQLLEQMSGYIDKKNVAYLGVISNEELMGSVLSKTDVLILTSRWETGPIVIWEAMSLGVVVLSSRYVGSQSEKALIHKYNCLLFDVGDTHQATNELSYLFNDENFQTLQRNGYELVKSRYSREFSVRAWENTFKTIAGIKDIELSGSRVKQWLSNGKIERIFGHKLGHFIRLMSGRSAYSNGAGSEWPHTYSQISCHEKKKFNDMLLLVESGKD